MYTTLLIISAFLNILFIWYIFQLLKRLLSLSDNMEDFFDRLDEYNEHIDVVHGLERFYGDETLGNLLKHSRAMLEETRSIREMYDPNYEDLDTEEAEE
jgi:hypothetical protein